MKVNPAIVWGHCLENRLDPKLAKGGNATTFNKEISYLDSPLGI